MQARYAREPSSDSLQSLSFSSGSTILVGLNGFHPANILDVSHDLDLTGAAVKQANTLNFLVFTNVTRNCVLSSDGQPAQALDVHLIGQHAMEHGLWRSRRNGLHHRIRILHTIMNNFDFLHRKGGNRFYGGVRNAVLYPNQTSCTRNIPDKLISFSLGNGRFWTKVSREFREKSVNEQSMKR